jgi:nitrous oxidase accessory protein
MRRVICLAALASTILVSLLPTDRGHLRAQTTLTVCAECPFRNLQAAVSQAPVGATIEVYRGTYAGPLLVDRPLTLLGHDWPVIDGGGQGTVVTISAPGVRIEGFVVRNSGSSHDREDSGIRVRAPRAAIVSNQVLDTLFGIYLEDSPDSLVERNVVVGKELPEPARGDGLKIWHSPRARLIENELRDIRDVLVWYSDDTVLQGNHVYRARYGLHFMYSERSLVESNIVESNSVGIYLMYGAQQTVRLNVLRANRGSSGYGLAIKETDGVVAEQNLIHRNRVGIYIDNSPLSPEIENRVTGNWVSYNDTGLLLTPATRRNRIAGNTFLENIQTVAVSGGGHPADLKWTENGRGNFWSDYVGYDADGDGIGDLPYQDEPLFESMSTRQPLLQFFRFSLAATAVDLAARAVPLFRPEPRVTDPAPLVAPGAWPAVPGSNAPPRWPHAVLAVALLALAAAGLATPWGERLSRGRWVIASISADRRPAPDAAASDHDTDRAYTVLSFDQQASPRPARSDDPLVIQVEHVTKSYGTRLVLDDLSFAVRQGEAVALCGPNGAGKTTVLRCMLGRTRYEGEIRIEGLSPRRDGARVRRRIGYVPQQLPVLDLGVGELLELVATLRGEPVERSWERLIAFGLGHTSEIPIRSLSGGMQQKLALALALVADPPILLLDEPTANLDKASRNELLHYLESLRDQGRTIVFTSHRDEEVWRLATRVIRLEHGRQQERFVPAARAHMPVALSLELEDSAVIAASHLLLAHGFSVHRHDHILRVLVEPERKAEPFFLLGQVGIRVVHFWLEETDAR